MSEVRPDKKKTWREHNTAKREFKRQLMEKKLEKLDQKKAEEPKVKQQPTTTTTTSGCTTKFSTLSIAVPGSILDNAQSAELRSYLAGQIARAACIYCVDEVIVYDDVGVSNATEERTVTKFDGEGEAHTVRRCCAQLARILQYLECPQYLRKAVFPIHKDLINVGLANPLDAPHHLRQADEFPYREGVILNQTCKSGSMVDVGLLLPIRVDRVLPPGFRVTVAMTNDSKKRGTVVSPMEPRVKLGAYWGYSVRLAPSLSTVFSQCPYPEGYDLTIGTSERGEPVESVSFKKHRHVLVVFGGLAGLEAAVENDDLLTVEDPSLLFNNYINTCPNQGSGTIRTEEAILISLAELRRVLIPKFPSTKATKSDIINQFKNNGSSVADADTSREEAGEVEVNTSAGNIDESTEDKLEGNEPDVKVVSKKRKKKKSKHDSVGEDDVENNINDSVESEALNVTSDINMETVSEETENHVGKTKKKHKKKKLD